MNEQGFDLPSKLNRDPDAPETPVGLEAENRVPGAAFADEKAGITVKDLRAIPGMKLVPGHLLCRRLVRGLHGKLVLPKNLTKPGDYFLVVDHGELIPEGRMASANKSLVENGMLVLASSFAGTTVGYQKENFILLAWDDVKGHLEPGTEADEFFRRNFCVTNRLDAG